MRLRTVAAALVAGCLAALVPAHAQQPGTISAGLHRVAAPNSGETFQWNLWGAPEVSVTEYRLWGTALEDALRTGSLELDPALLTPRRTWQFTGDRGQVEINRAAGVYVYVARGRTQWDPNAVQAEAVVVSSLRLGLKRDDSSTLLMVHRGGQPAGNVDVSVFRAPDGMPGGAARPTLLQRTQVNAWGLRVITTPQEGSLVYVAREGSHYAIQHTWDRSWSEPQQLLAHVQTDRPLYRPGQVVHWKAVLRETIVAGNRYRTPVDEPVRAFLRGPDGNRIPLGTLRTGPFGTVDGSYQLSDAARHGEYQLEVDAGPASGGERSVGAVGFGVEAYRKPEFKLTVTPVAGSYVQGQTVEATLAGDYFFGAPVAGARVRYTIKKQPRWRWWNPWIRPLIAEFCFPRPWATPQVVESGELTLGQDGRAGLRFQTAQDGVDADYVIEARASDASNREVVGSGQVAVTRAAFDLVLVGDRYVYQPGDLIQLQVQTADTTGAPVAGTRVTIKAEALDPQGNRVPRLTQTLVTGPDGAAALRLRAQNLGEYLLTATATDAAGNAVEATRTVFIHEQRSGTDWSWTDVKVVADRDTYEPGQTARLLVRAPVAAGVGVLAIETHNMHRRVAFPIVGGLALVAVPVSEDMAPNAFVSVLVPSRDGFKTAQLELLVPPLDALVEVKVTADRAEYRPGDTATFQVETLDGRGRPVAAEVALGVVDEALFALREDQTRPMDEVFFAPRWNGVTTVGAEQGFWRLFAQPEVLMATAMDKSAGGQQPGGVREYFPDTLRWIAQVVTDAQGRASVTQVMADSLTTWRLTSRAVTVDSRFGQSTTTTLVRKDLLVRLIAPRTLVEGDELTLTGIVHNLARPGTAGAEPASVQVQLQADGVRVVGPTTRTVSVPRDGQAVVHWDVRVERAGPAQLTASARSAFEDDALRLRLPVAARGVAARQVQAGALLRDGAVSFDLSKDPRAIDGGTELSLSITPSLAGTLLDSLDYLTGYPYGCIEQTMSRFLPDVIVGEVLRTIGREDPALSAELPQMVKTGLDRIQGMQNADGGWGWFANNASHPYVSAYVLGGLAGARRNGFDVAEPMFGDAVRFLEEQLRAGQLEPDGQAYLLFALGEAGVVRRPDLVALAARRDALNAYTQAALALALHGAGEATLAADVVRSLEARARTQAGKTHWQGDTISYGSWTSNVVETTALATRALLAVDPHNAKVAEAVAWLVERRQGNGQYTTTKDTAQVVLTFARYVVVTRELEPDLEAVVKLNGAEVARVRFRPTDLARKGHTVTIPGAQVRTGTNTVEVSRVGQGALYYSANLSQHVRMDPIPAVDQGISVRREYYRVARRVDQDGNLVEDLTPLTGDVSIGERVRVKLLVRVSQNAAVEHVNLEDRFPVGFEVADEREPDFGWWSWWRSAREVHDDRVVFFATHLGLVHPDGGQEYEYTYDLRAEVAGRFLALPSWAEAVYDPATHGRSAAQVLTVR